MLILKLYRRLIYIIATKTGPISIILSISTFIYYLYIRLV